MKPGKVYLIGAGPGDIGLLTIKGRDLIAVCDCIVYDYLANPQVLAFARPDAEIIPVGKHGDPNRLNQEQINRLLIEKALAGRTVARVKGGDPFIFGRGGEEAEELSKAGIEWEVVPGITSGYGAPAYAGIPVTHRQYTTSVAFITGHEDSSKDISTIAWDKVATGFGTLVFFMAVLNLPEIVRRLIENGRSPQTPVAVIRWGTHPFQETYTGTLETIIKIVEENRVRPPAITVVGDVVSLREKLNWFERKPLFGKRIIVTRARDQASSFAAQLQSLGAQVIECPTIEIVEPTSWDSVDNALENIQSYHWLIFTSVNGVNNFFRRLEEKGRDLRDLKGIRICAIGPSTAQAIKSLRLRVDLVPAEYKAEGVLSSLIEFYGSEDKLSGLRLLIPRARIARDVLPVELAKRGAEVDVAEVYRTIKPDVNREPIETLIRNGRVDVITFTSSSTVSNFAEIFGLKDLSDLLKGVKVACIGPITAETAARFGLKTDIMPEQYTTVALAEAIANVYLDLRG